MSISFALQGYPTHFIVMYICINLVISGKHFYQSEVISVMKIYVGVSYVFIVNMYEVE